MSQSQDEHNALMKAAGVRLQIMAASGQRVCTIVGKPLHLQNRFAMQYDDELEPTAAVGPRGDKST